MSPSSTADDTGNYGGFGVEGQSFPTNEPLGWCTTCATENAVSPHASAIALPVLPQQAYANLVALRSHYPGVYTGTEASTTRSIRSAGRSASAGWCSTSR